MEGYVSISVRKADKRKKEKGTDRRSILFLLFAVYGLLFLVGSVEGVDVDLPVFFLSAVPCLLLWGAGGLGKVFMYVSYGLMLVGSGVAFYFFRDVFCGQWLYIGKLHF